MTVLTQPTPSSPRRRGPRLAQQTANPCPTLDSRLRGNDGVNPTNSRRPRAGGDPGSPSKPRTPAPLWIPAYAGMTVLTQPTPVVPAQAGTQARKANRVPPPKLDSRLRGNDGVNPSTPVVPAQAGTQIRPANRIPPSHSRIPPTQE